MRRRQMIMLDHDGRRDRRHVRLRRSLSDNRPVLGLDLQGGISIVLFPVEGTDTSGARHRGRHHPQPRRRPRHRRARRAAPGQHDRRRPARREGPREGRGASSARPPSCGSARCEGALPCGTPIPTTTVDARPTTVAGDDHDHRRRRDDDRTRTDDRRRRRRRHGHGADAPSARTIADRADRARSDPRSRRRSRPTTTPTTVAGATPTTVAGIDPQRPSTTPQAGQTCSELLTPRERERRRQPRRGSRAARSTAEIRSRASCSGPTVLDRSQHRRRPRRATTRTPRQYVTDVTLQERRLRQEDREPYVEQAGRDRARRRRAVGADDQPRHHRPRRHDHRQLHARARRSDLALAAAVRRAAGAVRPRRADRRRACRRRSARTSCTPASSPASSASRSSRSTCSSSTGCSASSCGSGSCSPACCSSRSTSYLSTHAGPHAHARRRHRHHRVGRCHRRLLRRVLRATEGRGPHAARRCGRRSTPGSARSFRTIIAADLVSLLGAVVLYVARHRLGARLRVLPRPLDGRSTSCSRTASCTRSCRCSPGGPNARAHAGRRHRGRPRRARGAA